MDARRSRFAWPLRRVAAPRWLLALPPGDRQALLATLVLCAAGLPLSAGDTPVWWFGGALLLAAATLLGRVYGAGLRAQLVALRARRGLTPPRVALLVDVLCIGAVVAVGVIMLFEVVGAGDRPVGHAHATNYVRAWQLREQLLASGRLFGWSHDGYAGHPAHYLHPPGAGLWVNAVFALGFGALRFDTAYALAIVLVHLFFGVAVYRFGRLVGGPACGLIAALLAMTDVAEPGMGGFASTLAHGAFPETLALGFALMALCGVPAIAAGRGLRPLGAFGLFMGLALLTHPVQLIVLALLLASAALAAVLADGVKAASALFRLLLASGLSLLVAAPFLLPLAGARSEARTTGAFWQSSYELARGLLDLHLLPGTLGWVPALAVLALVVMLGTRRFPLLLTALLALCIPVASSSTTVDELHLPALVPAFSALEFARLASTAKPFWFVLAAYFAVAALLRAGQLARGADAAAPPAGSHARAAIFAAVLGLLTLPVLVPAAQAFWTRHVRKSLVTESERPQRAERARLERWLATELPEDGFYRVGLFDGEARDLVDLATVIDRPVYVHGVPPASSFMYAVSGDAPAILQAVNLRFAVARQHLSAELFEPLVEFGSYRVYRFKRFAPQPFSIVSGGGDVRVERFDDEEIVLRAAPGAHGKLRLNVSYFSRWRAYRDGRRVAMTITYLRQAPSSTGFMTVPLAPGRYRFAFERTLGDRLAIPLGALGVALCVLLIAAKRRQERLAPLRRLLAAVHARLDRFSEPAWRRGRALLALAASVLLIAGLYALGSWRPPLASPELGAAAIRAVRYDFLENLSRASANIEYRERNQPCLRVRDRLVCRDDAGNLDNDRYVASSPALLGAGEPMRCIRARPERGALLSVAFPGVPRGDAIVGYYGIEREAQVGSQRRPVELAIMVDGQTVHEGRTGADDRMEWFRADLPGGARGPARVVFSVRADNVNRRDFCFHAQMVALE
jgi:hypothetical protein